MFTPASLAGFAQMHNARAPARPIVRLRRWIRRACKNFASIFPEKYVMAMTRLRRGVRRARKNFASIFPEKYVEGMTNAECRMTKPRKHEAS
jgi:hypothetical protein